MWAGGAGNQTADLWTSRQPALLPDIATDVPVSGWKAVGCCRSSSVYTSTALSAFSSVQKVPISRITTHFYDTGDPRFKQVFVFPFNLPTFCPICIQACIISNHFLISERLVR